MVKKGGGAGIERVSLPWRMVAFAPSTVTAVSISDMREVLPVITKLCGT